MSNDKPNKGIDDESIPLFIKAHEISSEAQSDFYIDPITGYQVMTSYFLKNRGYCCKNNCRHCPYDVEDFKNEKIKKDS